MPMHRWMQSAAGGTSQRLKPAVAIVCSLSRKPAPVADTRPALLTVVIDTSPAAAITTGASASSIPPQPIAASVSRQLRTFPQCVGTNHAHSGNANPQYDRICPAVQPVIWARAQSLSVDAPTLEHNAITTTRRTLSIRAEW